MERIAQQGGAQVITFLKKGDQMKEDVLSTKTIEFLNKATMLYKNDLITYIAYKTDGKACFYAQDIYLHTVALL